MKKKTQNNLFLFFLIICFFLFFYNSCYARILEIDYPNLPTGETITPEVKLPNYLLYLYKFGFRFGFLIAVLSLVIAGALYILSIANPKLKTVAMDRIYGAITGFILLLLTYLIVTTINPSLGIFKFDELKKQPQSPPPPPPPGVYFYNNAKCSDNEPLTPHTSSMPDLYDLKNKINSVKIVNQFKKDSPSIIYLSILYDLINYQGKCEYIKTYENNLCQPIEPFAASVSIYRFNHNPVGNGVIFYRKPFYNKNDGFLEIKNADIKKSLQKSLQKTAGYLANLNDLFYTSDGTANAPCNVPEEEQDCIEWDIKKQCLKRKCPSLFKNINSIYINGDYVVMLIYFNQYLPGEDTYKKWMHCQVFPTVDDVNKIGPAQIKWEYIYKTGKYPNYIIIFPVIN